MKYGEEGKVDAEGLVSVACSKNYKQRNPKEIAQDTSANGNLKLINGQCTRG